MRNTWRTKVAFLAGIAMTAAVSAADTGSLNGTVVDSSGKGLRGAIVSAINEDQQKSISVLTDSQGRFILDQLPPELYVVRARLVGFDDARTDEIDISAGDSGNALKLTLQPAKDLLAQRTESIDGGHQSADE